MNEKDVEQAKQMLENFAKIDSGTQDKLLNGVKCLAFLYDMVDVKDNELPSQPVATPASCSA